MANRNKRITVATLAITAVVPAADEIEIAGIIFESSVATDIAALVALSDGPEFRIEGAEDGGDFGGECITRPINIKGLVNSMNL